MSDEVCPTCNRPKSFGKEISDLLENSGSIKLMTDKIVAAIPKLEIPKGFDIAGLEKTIGDAVSKIKVDLPAVKVVHHGLKELLECPSCKKDLDGYVSQQVNYARRRTETQQHPIVDSRPRGLFGS